MKTVECDVNDVIVFDGKQYQLKYGYRMKPTLSEYTEPIYRDGDCFRLDSNFGQTYYVMIVQVDSGVHTIINLTDGNRWCSGIKCPHEMNMHHLEEMTQTVGNVFTPMTRSDAFKAALELKA